MGGPGRIVGIILIVFRLAACAIVGFWAAAQMASGPELTLGGAALGLALVFFLVTAPCVGVGAYLLVKGRKEAAELAEVEKERKLLNIVLSRGQASISDLVLESGTTTDQVKAWIYDLVGKGLFSGYINWKDGILYSSRPAPSARPRNAPIVAAKWSLAAKA